MNCFISMSVCICGCIYVAAEWHLNIIVRIPQVAQLINYAKNLHEEEKHIVRTLRLQQDAIWLSKLIAPCLSLELFECVMHHSVRGIVYPIILYAQMYKILFSKEQSFCMSAYICYCWGCQLIYNTSDVAAGLGYNTKQLPCMHFAYMHMELARLGWIWIYKHAHYYAIHLISCILMLLLNSSRTLPSQRSQSLFEKYFVQCTHIFYKLVHAGGGAGSRSTILPSPATLYTH